MSELNKDKRAIRFTIDGEPQGKGRPQFSRNGDCVNVRTPKKTSDYEKWIKLEYLRQCGKFAFEKGVALKIDIYAFFKIPKSVSKKKQNQMLDGAIRPTKKPDLDNIVKVVADALNGVAYYDDAQIVSVAIKKHYGLSPLISVYIEEE